jgi:hypothetical protein
MEMRKRKRKSSLVRIVYSVPAETRRVFDNDAKGCRTTIVRPPIEGTRMYKKPMDRGAHPPL